LSEWSHGNLKTRKQCKEEGITEVLAGDAREGGRMVFDHQHEYESQWTTSSVWRACGSARKYLGDTIGSTLQIDSTRCSSMNDTIISVGARVPPARNTQTHYAGLSLTRKNGHISF
jgi:hypothetical protein